MFGQMTSPVCLSLCCSLLLSLTVSAAAFELDIEDYTGPDAVFYATQQDEIRDQLMHVTLDSYRAHHQQDNKRPNWYGKLEPLLKASVNHAVGLKGPMTADDAMALSERLIIAEQCKSPILYGAGML